METFPQVERERGTRSKRSKTNTIGNKIGNEIKLLPAFLASPREKAINVRSNDVDGIHNSRTNEEKDLGEEKRSGDIRSSRFISSLIEH